MTKKPSAERIKAISLKILRGEALTSGERLWVARAINGIAEAMLKKR